MAADKLILELPKNSREAIRLVDMRVFITEDGKDPIPTKKGLTIAPHLWPQFRRALAQAEAALIEAGCLDEEDLDG